MSKVLLYGGLSMNNIHLVAIIKNLAKLVWIRPMRSRQASKQSKYQTEEDQTLPEKVEAIPGLFNFPQLPAHSAKISCETV